MTVRRLNSETHDIVTSGVQFVDGRSEVAQTILTRLKLFLGEYFRNINDGTPWFQEILGKGGSLSQRDSIIKRRIVESPGVNRVVDFETGYDIDTREYFVRASVLTEFGLIDIRTGGVN